MDIVQISEFEPRFSEFRIQDPNYQNPDFRIQNLGARIVVWRFQN